LETDLYPPIKVHLEKLGLEVKGEVCRCDLVALSGAVPELVVIGEMKQSFTLELVLQAVDRTSACDEVWLAIRASKRGRGRENDARVKKLCRFLGFGLLTVNAEGRVDVVSEPVPWKPRRDAKRRSRIVEEHRRRKGDPVVGGSTSAPQMTAYRQQALAVANGLSRTPSRPRDLRILAPDAAKILRGNVYGWFERIERGLYGLSSSGRGALVTWADHFPPENSAVNGQGPGAVLSREIGGEIADERDEIALRDRRRRFANHQSAGAKTLDDEAEARKLLRMRFDQRRCVGIEIDDERGQQSLPLDCAVMALALEPLIDDALMRRVLVDESRPSSKRDAAPGSGVA
jgi:hypothetical protein